MTWQEFKEEVERQMVSNRIGLNEELNTIFGKSINQVKVDHDIFFGISLK